jgi:hypothetical protein
MSITGIGDQPAGIFNRQVFAASGTWTKPTGASMVRVQVLGAGSGGGSGRRGATGSTRLGGAGGSAGTYVDQWFNAGFLPSTVAVTVGTGGVGGASIGANDTNGNPGATGAASSFGTILASAPIPGFAQGGSTSGAPNPPSGWTRPSDAATITFGAGGQAGVGGAIPGYGGSSDTGTGTPHEWDPAHNNGLPNQPVGGGGGGALVGSGSSTTGGAGLQNLAMDDANTQTAQPPIAGFTGAGPVPVASPKQLTDTLYGCIPYYSGAGGSTSLAGAGITGGTGGPGGSAQGYGAGGGGGGASANGFPSGTGGNGAPGLVIVTSY